MSHSDILLSTHNLIFKEDQHIYGIVEKNRGEELAYCWCSGSRTSSAFAWVRHCWALATCSCSNCRSSLAASSEVPPPSRRGCPAAIVAQPPARAAAVAQPPAHHATAAGIEWHARTH